MVAKEAYYRRVSSEEQGDNYSLPAQQDSCLALARARGLDIETIADYCELVSAETLAARPKALALLREIEVGNIRTLIVWKLDRLARNMFDGASVMAACERVGCAVISVVEGPVDFSPTGKLMAMFHMFGAEQELVNIKLRFAVGKRKRVESGKLLNNRLPPYGYRFSDDRTRYEIDEATAPIVQRIFREYTAGATLDSLARRLTDEGIPTARGAAAWDRAVLYKIIGNEDYIGKHYAYKTMQVTTKGGKKGHAPRPREEWVLQPDVAPVLIDGTTFATAQERLQQNKARSPRSLKNPERYLLRGGLVVCGLCGRNLGVDDLSKKYRCTRQGRSNGSCPRHPHDALRLDMLVWSRIVTTLSQIEYLRAAILERQEHGPDLSELPNIERELATIERSRRNLVVAIERADEDDDLTDLLARRKTLAARQRELETKRTDLLAQSESWRTSNQELSEAIISWQHLAAELRRRGEELYTLPYAQKRAWLERLKVRVVAHGPDHLPQYDITADVPLVPSVNLLPGVAFSFGGDPHEGTWFGRMDLAATESGEVGSVLRSTAPSWPPTPPGNTTKRSPAASPTPESMSLPLFRPVPIR